MLDLAAVAAQLRARMAESEAEIREIEHAGQERIALKRKQQAERGQTTMGKYIERTEYVLLDPGIYPARVLAVTPEAGQFGPQLKIEFGIEDEQSADERTMIAWCSESFSPKSKLFGWVKVLLFGGRDIPADFPGLDTDQLLGKRCMVNVIHKPGNDGTQYAKISDLIPVKQARPGTAPRTAATAARTAAPVASGPVPVGRGDRPGTPDNAPGWLTEGEDEGLPF